MPIFTLLSILTVAGQKLKAQHQRRQLPVQQLARHQQLVYSQLQLQAQLQFRQLHLHQC